MLMLIAGIGFFLRWKKVFSDGVVKGINSLILMVTWPAMSIMITQKEYTPETLRGFLLVLAASTVFMALTLGIGALLFRGVQDKKRRAALACLCSIPNAGFMGMPIVDALYGDIGLLYMAAFIMGFNIVVWTLGTMLFEGFNIKAAFKGLMSPGFIGTLLGMILFVARIKLPDVLGSCVTQLGNLNTPLAMLILGARMDGLKLKSLCDGKLWAAYAVKLVAAPLLLYAALYALGVRDILLVLPTLLMAMPAAAACQMLCERYDADVSYAATGVSISTLLCIITVPLTLLLASL